MAAADTCSFADQVCLAIIGEGQTHGWAIVKLLHPDGEIGRIWSLSRPLTYRSIDQLVTAGLVRRVDQGRRAELHISPAGRRLRRSWLSTPVDHLRDLRTEFLVKIALSERAGQDTTDLVDRQRRHLAAAIDALTSSAPQDPVSLWRQESALAARRFLERVGTTRS